VVGELKRKFRLSSAINCLEQLPTDSRREVIVVELFPAEPPLPTDMWEVVNRLGQLIFASKLKFDRKLFRTIDGIITFLQKIQPHIPEQFRDDSVYQELFVKHKKIDALTAIVADFPKDQANAEDFSRETIRSRIESGYE
jgi:NTE family protein